jgi:hypothetical protein
MEILSISWNDHIMITVDYSGYQKATERRKSAMARQAWISQESAWRVPLP